MEQQNTNTENMLPPFDDLLTMPNGSQIVRNVLRSARQLRNTMHISEFRQYEPLFRYSGKDELGEERLSSLTYSYFEKISPYDPVLLVDNDNNVLFTIPPVWNRVSTIDSLGQVGSDIALAFSNANQLPDEVSSGKRGKYLNCYKQLLEVAHDPEELKKIRAVVTQMSEDLLKDTRTAYAKAAEEQGIPEEIEDLGMSELKDTQSNTSSATVPDEPLPYGGDEEVEYL